MERREYVRLVRKMLEIGMVVLREKVKVVNGVFGVWKVRPEGGPGRRTNRSHRPGSGAHAPPGPHGPKPGTGAEGSHGYRVPGKIRLIIDMRRGNCYFYEPEKVEMVTPTALAQIHLTLRRSW